jgi:glycosyltransferase involved in cell wall biosynthesis
MGEQSTRPPTPDPVTRLRVALYSGAFVRYDAISNSLGLKLDLLDRWRAAGEAIDVTAFVCGTDSDDPRVVVCPTVSELVRQPGFHDADVHLFEFGIYYPLFDAVFLLPPERMGVVFHNITPPELVDESARPLIERSFSQLQNATRAGAIACDSEYNRDVLVGLGFDPARLSVLHLPAQVSVGPGAHEAAGDPSRPVELLCVGRLVRPKGVYDVLDAVERLVNSGLTGFRVTWVGNRLFSEPCAVAAVESAARRRPDIVRYLGEVHEEQLSKLYESADVVVAASYHEGFCVPVLEGYASGCQLVAYNSGNLPYIVGGLGQVVPVGDVGALCEAMSRAVEAARSLHQSGDALVPVDVGQVPAGVWRARVREHLECYSEEGYERGLRHLIGALAGHVLTPPAVGSGR